MGAPALAQLPVFLAVAEHRSFTAAARSLRMSTSAVSQAVLKLEKELGVVLLVRTTRSVSMTDAGTRLVAEAAPGLRAVSEALASARTNRDVPTGTLRLNVPRIASRVGLPAVLREYARRYPEVRTEVVVDDRRIDLVEHGFDAGVRSRAAIQKDMIRVQLTPAIRFAVVGSKRYFAAHGRPKHPRDLVDHACLGWRSLRGESEYRWELVDRGKPLEVAVSGPVFSNDTELLVACAAHDLGLAFVVEAEADRDIAAGRLETVLDDYVTGSPGLFLYYPRAARSVPKLRAFADCARAVVQQTGARRR